LQIELGASVADDETPAAAVVGRRFGIGAAVAFPSKITRHRVTQVTRGERRSLLLLCSARGPGELQAQLIAPPRPKH
jgi:hypothetical protein